jgi:hypothetical protein
MGDALVAVMSAAGHNIGMLLLKKLRVICSQSPMALQSVL